MLVKAPLHQKFSLIIFGWSQILMDIQPLIALITNAGPLHGFSHTYVGATLLAILSALTGKYLAEFIFKNLPHYESNRISWKVALISAFIGTYSHIVLDSIMHRDMQPFYPFSDANGLLGLISVESLYRFCVYSALLGGALHFLLKFVNAWHSNEDKGEI
jgi:membrane-bound metal-dependent hydrolase YbcI (DUF457 family)